MRKCRHPSPWGYRRHLVVDGEIKSMLFCKCDCGAWLPLGPARDTPETAIEVRAAEIAAQDLVMDYDDREADGYFNAERDPFYAADEDDEWWWAGWLAYQIDSHDRVIASHGEQGGER